jgi:hypothetical protein
MVVNLNNIALTSLNSRRGHVFSPYGMGWLDSLAIASSIARQKLSSQ